MKQISRITLCTSFLFALAAFFGFAGAAFAQHQVACGTGTPLWLGASRVCDYPITYEDPLGGSNLQACEYKLVNGNTDPATVPWITALGTCTGNNAALWTQDITTGSTGTCTVNGEDTCKLYWKATDNGGNSNEGQLVAFDIDYVLPTVTLEKVSGQADPTKDSPITFTVVFRESVTGFDNFDNSDVVITGTAGGTKTVTITPLSSTTYNIAVIGMTSGTVTVDIPADAAIDAARNGNTASTSSDNSVIYDVVKPEIHAFDVAPKIPAWVNSATVNVAVSFEISDAHSGLQDVEVWRENPAGHAPEGWQNIGRVFASSLVLKEGSSTNYLGSYQDPASALLDGETYRYGIHVNDQARNMCDENMTPCGDTTQNKTPGDAQDSVVTLSVQVDKTLLVTSIRSVSGDFASPYWDNTNNSQSSIEVQGEQNMQCRWYDTDSDYTANTGTVCSVDSESSIGACSLGPLAEASSYTKHVSCQDAAGNKQSITQNLDVMFGVDWTPPATPTLVSPTGVINTQTPSFDWTDSTDATSGGITYELLVDNESLFNTPVEVQERNIGSSSFAVSSQLSQGQHYWKVRAKDQAENLGFYASASTFTIDTAVPTALITTPEAGSTQLPPSFFTTFTYSKSGEVSSLFRCEYKVESNGSTTLDWTSAGNCLGSFSASYGNYITVGPGLNCQNTGVDACTIRARATDSNGTVGPEDSRSFTIRSGTRPDVPYSLGQFKNDGVTAIPNQGFTNESSVQLRASATDADMPEVLTLFFEVKPQSGFFSSAGTVPTITSSCASGTAFDACESKIWHVTSRSGRHTTRNPFVGTVEVTGLSSGEYKWKVKACDDEPACSTNWRRLGTTPNFKVDTNAPQISVVAAPATVTTEWQNASGTATVSCSDVTGSGCVTASYKLQTYTSLGDGACSTTYGDYTLADSYLVQEHVWVCAAAKDAVGNTGFSPSRVEFKVDQEAPSITLDEPSASWLHQTTALNRYYLRVIDEDADSPIDPTSCAFDVCSYETNGTEHCGSVTERTCNTQGVMQEILVGPGPNGRCNYEGEEACALAVSAKDEAGNLGEFSQTYGVDWTPPTTGRLYTGATEPGPEETYAIQALAGVPFTMRVHVTENIRTVFCNLYIDNTLRPEISLPAPGCTKDCTLEFQDIVVNEGGTFQNNYAVCYDASSLGGGGTSVGIDVRVNTAPVAAISCDPSCTVFDSQTLTMQNDSTDADGQNDIVESAWDILSYGASPDATCPPGPSLCNYTVQPMAPQTYTMQLQVKDSQGVLSTAQKPFTLRQDVQASFECSLDGSTWKNCSLVKPAAGELFYVKDTSTPSEDGNAIVQRTWTFQDGSPASASASVVSTVFQGLGSKAVTLQVTDNKGRTGISTKNITLLLAFPKWQEIFPF